MTDLRQTCFYTEDILKLVLLITKTKGNSIVPLLDKYGFDTLWNNHFGDYSLKYIVDFSNDDSLVTLNEHRNEKRISSFTFCCPAVKYTSYDLLEYVRQNRLYLAEILHKCKRPSRLVGEAMAISHTWKRNLIEVLVHCLNYQNNVPVWLDIVNINQNARNIATELLVIRKVFTSASQHIMISREDLSRGWCFFEYALRNSVIQNTYDDRDKLTWFPEKSHQMTEDFLFLQDLNNMENMHDFIKTESFRFYKTEFTVESDRDIIESEILKLFGSVEVVEEKIKESFASQGQLSLLPSNKPKTSLNQRHINLTIETARKHNIIIPEFLFKTLPQS